MSHVQYVNENNHKISGDIPNIQQRNDGNGKVATAYIDLKHQHVLVIRYNVSIIQQ